MTFRQTAIQMIGIQTAKLSLGVPTVQHLQEMASEIMLSNRHERLRSYLESIDGKRSGRMFWKACQVQAADHLGIYSGPNARWRRP